MVSESKALPIVDFGFFLGLSTPNEQINNIYNSEKLEQENVLGNLVRDGAKTGLHIGILAKIPLAADFELRASLAWHHFPETEMEISNPDQEISTAIANISTSQDLFPIAVGLNYLFLDGVVFDAYATGELAYYHFSNDADYSCWQLSEVFPNQAPFDIDKSPSYNRVGFGIGAGCTFDAQIMKFNLEVKYNWANLIATESDESRKDFLNVSLGVFL